MDVKFEVSGHEYAAGRLNAFQQQHIVRRIAPLATSLISLIGNVQNDPMAAFQPMLEAFARMPDEDVDYVMQTCLQVVTRKQKDTWAKICIPNGGLMFADIELLEMNEIVFHVLKANLSNFFKGLAQKGLIPVVSPTE